MNTIEKKRLLIKKSECILILAAVLVIAVFLFIRAVPGDYGTARVFVNGRQILEMPLREAENGRINLREYDVPAELEIEDGKIRFVDVTCPDHICEKTGFVWKDGQTAVCMPNRMAVVIVA